MKIIMFEENLFVLKQEFYDSVSSQSRNFFGVGKLNEIQLVW